MMKGRLSLKREAIERKDELHRMLKVLEKEHMVKSPAIVPLPEEVTG
jgi:hypothetical protein